jgi:hypothetical protein
MIAPSRVREGAGRIGKQEVIVRIGFGITSALLVTRPQSAISDEPSTSRNGTSDQPR